ncbi:MAG: exodeoxyribonuclease V subunit gamma [Candidatus Muirbacterium halophilum]|nr:exodeoxyribonuclease V subunit gamma [Candidatus Muirbacterium halophilum]MCK9476744.1 exodeoxyribonuclease V subunit gamma [Candidatus Muirbacterium halophilum]
MNTKLFLYERTKLEELIQIFSQTYMSSKSDPFKKDVVIVQSQGMARWITRKSAEINGIFTNVEFMFPNAFIEKFFNGVFGDKYKPELISGKVNAFRIMNVLMDEREKNPNGIFKEIFDYVGDFETRLFKISSVLSEIFENYQLFRPDLIRSFKHGDIDKFRKLFLDKKDEFERQFELYKRIMPEDLYDKSDVFYEICNNFSNLSLPDDFPDKIYIFGVSILPPYFLKVFEQISTVCEVHLFLMNPCTEYWIDIVSRKESAKKFLQAAKITGIDNLQENELHFYIGNSLLAEFGSMGREFFSQILEFSDEISDNLDSIDIKRDNLLHCIQHDISTLSQGNKSEFVFKESDNSIIINSCHGIRRELEVLKDFILDVLDNNSDIHPSDIIVMAPDIHQYSQLIDSVFSDFYFDNKISYSISDVALSEEDPIISTFLEIIEKATSKFTVSDVLSIMERPIIMQSFGFDEKSVEIIRYWIAELNIRFGFDDDFFNSWKHGIKRLITGYFSDCEEVLWDEVTSYPYIEGEYALIAGNFAAFIDFLEDLSSKSNFKNTIEQWGFLFYEIIKKLQDNSQDISKFNILINNIDILCGENNIQKLSDFNEKISFDIIRTFLKRQFKNSLSSKGFLSDGITFSSMLPMRSIPFKVICLLGMNIDSFPGKEKKLEFDLVREKPKVGDRSKRKSDMYLFLETIMSVRDKLYISYNGQSEKDNSKKEPSVLVSIFIDYIKDYYHGVNNKILDNVWIEHRLHGFHSIYFNKENMLYSYSSKNFDICLKRDNVINESFKFKQRELCEKIDFDISDILSFYKEPIIYFVKKILNIYDYNNANFDDEFEQYKIDNLERYFIRSKIYSELEKSNNKSDIYKILKFSGILPVNNFGKIDFEKEYEIIKELFDLTYSENKTKTILNFQTDSGFNFEGDFNIIQDENQFITFSSFKGKYFLQAFISHIIASKLSQKPKKTVLYSINDYNIKKTSFEYNDIVKDCFDYIINLFIKGQSFNIPLFSEAFLSYYDRFKKDKSEEDCKKSAISKLKSDKFNFSIVDDFEFKFIYKDSNPFELEENKIYWECYKKISEFIKSMEVENE